MSKTTIKLFLELFDTNSFKIGLIPVNKQKKVHRYTRTQNLVISSLNFYREKNLEDYHVFFRPNSYSAIMLDDITREELHRVKKLNPCAYVETSPQNYQVWLQLAFIPSSREHALKICRKLALEYNADLGSAEPNHLARLPCFQNRKPKHQKNNVFPTVQLRKFAKRYANIDSSYALDFKPDTVYSPSVLKPKKNLGHDRSREDFNTACMLIRQKKDDNFIRDYLEKHSEKARERRDNYVERTIRNARKVVGIYV